MQDVWDNLSRDDIRYFYDHLNARIRVCVAVRGGYTVYCCVCLGTPYFEVCFIWFEIVIIYSNNDKLPVTSIWNTIT